MSKPKTITGKLLHALGLRKIFLDLAESLKSKDPLTEKAKAAVLALQRLKLAVNSRKIDALTDIIPGSWDNAAVLALRYVLGAILKAVGVSPVADPVAAAKYAVTNLIALPVEDQNSKYKQIAVALLLSETTVSELSANEIIETEYQKIKAAA